MDKIGQDSPLNYLLPPTPACEQGPPNYIKKGDYCSLIIRQAIDLGHSHSPLNSRGRGLLFYGEGPYNSRGLYT